MLDHPNGSLHCHGRRYPGNRYATGISLRRVDIRDDQPRRASEAFGRMQVSNLTPGSANYNFILRASTRLAVASINTNIPTELSMYP